MALINLPILGTTTNSIYVDTSQIVELRTIYMNSKFHVRAVVGIGTSYILNLTGAPFNTEADAIVAMQTFVAATNDAISVFTSQAVTITVADWAGGTSVVKNIADVTLSTMVWASPAPASIGDATTFGVDVSAQGNGTLTFTASTTPTADIIFNVIIGG